MKILKTIIIDSDTRISGRLSDLFEKIPGLLGDVISDFEGNQEEMRVSIEEEKPDVLVIGIDNMDSQEMQLFEWVRKNISELPIIVLTQHNDIGAKVALHVLKKGAIEYVTKTKVNSKVLQSDEHFRERLIPVIKVVPRINHHVLSDNMSINEKLMARNRLHSDYFEGAINKMDLLVVAGCLGGIPALYQLLYAFPSNLPVPVIVVQHMPKLYTGALAEDLNNIAMLDVTEAKDGQEINPGTVYVAPGGYHAKLENENNTHIISLYKGPKVHGYRPSIDVLLQSAQSIYGNKVLSVYMSGGGNDGIEGAEVIDIAGGQIIIQNKRSSLLWDLPWKVGGLGIDEGRYSLERMGDEISKRLIVR